jgi:hypothetical protein
MHVALNWNVNKDFWYNDTLYNSFLFPLILNWNDFDVIFAVASRCSVADGQHGDEETDADAQDVNVGKVRWKSRPVFTQKQSWVKSK